MAVRLTAGNYWSNKYGGKCGFGISILRQNHRKIVIFVYRYVPDQINRLRIAWRHFDFFY